LFSFFDHTLIEFADGALIRTVTIHSLHFKSALQECNFIQQFQFPGLCAVLILEPEVAYMAFILSVSSQVIYMLNMTEM